MMLCRRVFMDFSIAEALFICLVLQGTLVSLFVGLKQQLAGDDAVSAAEQVTVSLCCACSFVAWCMLTFKLD